MLAITEEEITKNWKATENGLPLVSVRCTTFNQEKYIAECLEGFLIQKTDFPFEVIVHEDASTDKTAKIIREYELKYPNIIKPIYETENQYSKQDGSFTRIINAHLKGKYIAMCEGDDYWIDENKLQRQVDFLESHPDYVLSAENGYTLYTNNNKMKLFSTDKSCDYSMDEMLMKRRFPTASVLYPRKFQEAYAKLPKASFDTKLWVFLATKGKVHFDATVSSVYRRGSGVTESNKIKWITTAEKFDESLEYNFPISEQVRKHRKETFLIDLKNGYYAAKKQKDFRNRFRLFFKILKTSPLCLIKHSLNSKKRKLKWFLKQHLTELKYNLLPVSYGITKKEKPEIVVSLTSYPARFNTLHLCLKSLLHQSVKPDKLILYLDLTVDKNKIPRKILALKKKGLIIKNICNDIKPHKKYFYAMQEFPDAVIVTADDDIIYDFHWLESLWNSYKKYPNAISARRVHLITRDQNKKAMPYNSFVFECEAFREPSSELLATGHSGVLYPPHLFHLEKNYFKEENIKKYCVNADDIWLKFIELKENIPVVFAPSEFSKPLPIQNESLKNTALQNKNVLENQNDIAIKNCESFFGFEL